MLRDHPFPKRIAGATAVAAVLVVGVAGTSLAGASDKGGYRVATVRRASVQKVLKGAGTISPVARAAVSFPSAGTVEAVAVRVGQKVTVGQQLATLDRTSLRADVDSAAATLAQAKLTLAEAEAGQLPSAGSGGSGGSGSGSSGSAGSSAPSSAAATAATAQATTTSAALRTSARVASSAVETVAAPVGASGGASSSSLEAQIRAAQKALLALQKRLDAALLTARADLAAATAACASTATSTSTTSTTSTSTPTASSGTDCATAQQRSLDDLATVASLEAQVGHAITALDALLARAAATGGTTGSSASTGPSAATGTTGGSGTSGGSSASSSGSASGTGAGSTTGATPSSSSASSTSSTPTAQELVAYQAAVDAAATKVEVAEQSLAAATIVSPIAGTVTSVTLAAGDAVTASSTTANVVVAGSGGFEVSVPVSVTDRASVAVGDAATVVPDSTGKVLPAKVVSIGVAGTASGTSTSYTVVLGLTGAPAGLRDGASAGTSITVASVQGALVVPTSAVRTTGTRHTVSVLSGGRTHTVVVKLGTVGADLTAVTSGVKAGDEVVLAQLNAALPSSASTASTRSTTRFGPPNGFTGGPPSGAAN